jgi:hypothetical protein
LDSLKNNPHEQCWRKLVSSGYFVNCIRRNDTMKFGKTILYTCAAILFATKIGVAQSSSSSDTSQAPAIRDRSGPGLRPHSVTRELAALTKQLKLTTDQQDQIRTILEDRESEMRVLQSDHSLTRQERHAKMDSIMDASRGKIEAVLTNSQKETFEKERQQMLARKQRERDDSAGPDGPPDGGPPDGGPGPGGEPPPGPPPDM